jgi:hypothetical protein
LVGVLAASPLTVGSNRKSAALRADVSFVAETGLVAALPLSLFAGPMRKSIAGVMKLDATGVS